MYTLRLIEFLLTAAGDVTCRQPAVLCGVIRWPLLVNCRVPDNLGDLCNRNDVGVTEIIRAYDCDVLVNRELRPCAACSRGQPVLLG